MASRLEPNSETVLLPGHLHLVLAKAQAGGCIDKTQTANSDDLDQLDVSALTDKVIDDKELEKVLINDDCVYRQKCKLGFQVEKIMKKYGIQKESLRSEFKEALDQLP